ncbi:hypothetical protein LTR36_010958, partial [Oleoguttula mirabilis]
QQESKRHQMKKAERRLAFVARKDAETAAAAAPSLDVVPPPKRKGSPRLEEDAASAKRRFAVAAREPRAPTPEPAHDVPLLHVCVASPERQAKLVRQIIDRLGQPPTNASSGLGEPDRAPLDGCSSKPSSVCPEGTAEASQAGSSPAALTGSNPVALDSQKAKCEGYETAMWQILLAAGYKPEDCHNAIDSSLP